MGLFDAITKFNNDHLIISGIFRLILFALLAYLAFRLVAFILHWLMELITSVLAWLYRLRIDLVSWFDDLIPGKLSSSPFDLLACAGIFALLWFWAPSATILQHTAITPFLELSLFQLSGFRLCAVCVVGIWAICYVFLGGIFGLPIAVFFKTLRLIIEIPYLPLTLLLIFADSDSTASSGSGGTMRTPLRTNVDSIPLDTGATNKRVYHYSGTDNESGYHNPDDYGGGYTDRNGTTHYYRKETSAPEEVPVERDEDGYARFNP